MPEPVLYRWPVSAAFGRVVPKAKFYERGKVRPALRAKFVSDVRRISWSFKLADSTIRLRGTTAVPEIQVFTVEAKGDDISDDVLAAIDRSVHFPIIFEVVGAGRVRTVAAQKSLEDKLPKVGVYFSSGWQPADASRQVLPTALDLPNLYEIILGSLLPVSRRRDEALAEAIARIEHTRKLRRGITALERKLRAEPQLNRKIEIRTQVKALATILAKLTSLTASAKD